MSFTTIECRQIAYGTAAEWTAINPILAKGEEGYETDTKKRKVGDGVTRYNSLAYEIHTSGNGGAAFSVGALTATALSLGASADAYISATGTYNLVLGGGADGGTSGKGIVIRAYSGGGTQAWVNALTVFNNDGGPITIAGTGNLAVTGTVSAIGNCQISNSASTDTTTNVWLSLIKTASKGYSIGIKGSGAASKITFNSDTAGAGSDLVTIDSTGLAVTGVGLYSGNVRTNIASGTGVPLNTVYDFTIVAVNNTEIDLKMRGDDSVTRAIRLTLA